MTFYHNMHKHTYYSNLRTLDSICSPEEYMKRAVELGHTTYFCGEHGYQGDLYSSQKLCEKYGLKPIYSVEAYYADDITDRTNRSAYHILLVGMTKKARYEINKIMSIANTEGFYQKPRIGLKELLSLSPQDTIVTTACVATRMFKGTKEEWYDGFFIPVSQHFGDNFYFELQSHNDDKQINLNRKLLKLREMTGTKIIHANDSHYIYPEDAKYRDLFLKAKGIVYPEEDGFCLDYPDADEIIKRYETQGVLSEAEAREALANTLVFDNAEPVYTDDEFKIPAVPNEFIKEELGEDYSNDDPDKVLREIIRRAWKEKSKTVKPEKKQEYIDAIYYEMDIIKKCGMASYFILDHMVVKRAVEKYGAVLTRSGRGSAVSFLVNHLLGLTEVDRIKAPVRLYPTRFMSAERILQSRSLPDIDLNWANVDGIIQATKDILGDDQIYYMLVYKPLQRSSAFRLWCKAHDYDINEYDECAKFLREHDKEIDLVKETYPKWANEIDRSEKFVGVIESISPSPCSFLLLNEPISEEVGLIKVKDEMCCCIDGYSSDLFKYTKNDYLTVTCYEIIDKVYKAIGRPIDDIATLVNNCDDEVWDIFAKGLTIAVNQCETDSGRQRIARYKPKNLGELSAWVAAIRPGFASLLDTFLDRKEYSNGVEELDEILKDASSFMLYQEGLMSYFIWLGMEEKVTYDIIKKVAKKKFKHEELEELKGVLKKGWVEKVGSEDGFDGTFQVVEDAARYSFNAAHACSVAIDALYGAYLKCKYPLEFYSETMTIYRDDIDKTKRLTEELPHFGIKLNDIKFRKSNVGYTIDRETNSIYKGLSAIKYMNDTVAEQLYDMRDKQYGSFFDLLEDINKNTSIDARQLRILIVLNFFSEFHKNKKLLDMVKLYDGIGKRRIIKKTDLEKLNISEDTIKKYAGTETNKQFKDINMAGLLNELAKDIPDSPVPIKLQIEFEIENLGYSTYKSEKLNEKFYCVTDMKVYKDSAKPYVTLRNLHTGEDIKTKITQRKIFTESPFGLYSVIRVDAFTEKPKMRKQSDGTWKDDPNETELIISAYETIAR